MLQHFGEVQSVDLGLDAENLCREYTLPRGMPRRLVVFFTDFVLSIVRTLVSATPRGDLGRWV
jgi:hypothetical protein